MQKIMIGVVGGNSVSDENASLAYEVGRHIALNDAVLVCGGLGGAMEAASRGAAENGGTVVGLLPGADKAEANAFVTVPIPTGMGVGRNVLVVRASDVLIAFSGSHGTLSEMALALSMGKMVVHMPGSWDLSRIGKVDASQFKEAHGAAQAVGLALTAVSTASPMG